MSWESNEDYSITISPNAGWISFADAVSRIAHRYLACRKFIFKLNGKVLDLEKINATGDAECDIYIDLIEKKGGEDEKD
jgi:hypothetical protein